MGLHIYRKRGKNVRGGALFNYVGEFEGVWKPGVLQSPQVAKALGEGEHELIAAFTREPGAPRTDGPLNTLSREFVRVERAPAQVRVTSVESLI